MVERVVMVALIMIYKLTEIQSIGVSELEQLFHITSLFINSVEESPLSLYLYITVF